MKKVLITGANSYIGTGFERYAIEHYPQEFSIDTIDMIDGSWREKSFSEYDVVYHVAGMAHADVGNVSEEIKAKYYAVNTDLAVETAKKAKEEGVKLFVFMSSAIVYGDSVLNKQAKMITAKTEPKPANFYGDSKLQAEFGIQALADSAFQPCILRPPMIYGKGSKGNYLTLSKMAKILPLFPDVSNVRSMLYIENLCEFLCQVMIRGESGIFFPQNKEHTRTSQMVKCIAHVYGHKMWVSKAWNWVIALVALIPGRPRVLVNKAFGNLAYDQNISKYQFDYQIVDFKESIRRTEG